MSEYPYPSRNDPEFAARRMQFAREANERVWEAIEAGAKNVYQLWQNEGKAAKAAGLYAPITFAGDAGSGLRSRLRHAGVPVAGDWNAKRQRKEPANASDESAQRAIAAIDEAYARATANGACDRWFYEDTASVGGVVKANWPTVRDEYANLCAAEAMSDMRIRTLEEQVARLRQAIAAVQAADPVDLISDLRANAQLEWKYGASWDASRAECEAAFAALAAALSGQDAQPAQEQ